MSAPKGLGGSGLSGGNLPPALQQQLAALASQTGGKPPDAGETATFTMTLPCFAWLGLLCSGC